MSTPERMCIGCRERAAKRELLRLTAVSATVALDPGQTAPGRGAYLHRSRHCLELALRRRALGRAFRGSGVDVGAVVSALEDVLLTDGGTT